MFYYNSQYLSNKLGINLSKWKRWSREFLPPDPLGGLQSGVARQFNLGDSFKVYLGGYLVAQMKFSIPDSKSILDDLTDWLASNDFFALQPPMNRSQTSDAGPRHHIYIYGLPGNAFAYCIRSIQSLDTIEHDLQQETYVQYVIYAETDPIGTTNAKSAHVLAITTMYHDFLRRIE